MELSIDDIKALPFVNDEIAEIIKQALLKIFDADIYQRRKTDSCLPEWEEIVALRE